MTVKITNTNTTSTAKSFTTWNDDWLKLHFDSEPEYDVATTLLRDYAQRSCDYLEKKEISQYGWKSRKELRNV